MTNEELKEKIVDILVNCKSQECAVEYCAACEGNPDIEHCREKEQADALIAAGLRFGENLTATFDRMALEREHQLERRLGEAEHRAEIAEKALSSLVHEMYEHDIRPMCDEKFFIESRLKEAEKELEEERKDD